MGDDYSDYRYNEYIQLLLRSCPANQTVGNGQSVLLLTADDGQAALPSPFSCRLQPTASPSTALVYIPTQIPTTLPPTLSPTLTPTLSPASPSTQLPTPTVTPTRTPTNDNTTTHLTSSTNTSSANRTNSLQYLYFLAIIPLVVIGCVSFPLLRR